ncbi:hypothetical protein V1503_19665 [Bacillus sp. SCS-151]|uniref:hypothetical protein n=1 Tax=Nanhaiella sioensis TaxID=3115293 RepID=UPI00397DDA37
MNKKKVVSLLTAATFAISLPVSASAADYAYSVGTDYADGSWWESGVDTSQSAMDAATDFALAGYSSYYNIKPTVAYFQGDAPDGNPRMESDILFFAGHANNELMTWNYDNKGGDYKVGVYYTNGFVSSTTDYTYVGLNDYNLNGTKLMVFAGCETASGSTNLLTKATDNGADSAVGFVDKVATASATKWRGKFTDAIGLGKSISQAITYADSFSYDDDRVLTSTYEGSGSLIVKQSNFYKSQEDFLNKSLVSKESKETPVIGEKIKEKQKELPVNKDIKFDFQNEDYTEIVNYISSIEDMFNLGDYTTKIKEKEDGNGSITFNYTIDSIETNVKYTAVIEDNLLTTIYLNGKLPKKEEKPSTKKVSADQLTQLLDNVPTDEDYRVVNQFIKEKIDLESNQQYIVAITDYEHIPSGTFVSGEIVHEIN